MQPSPPLEFQASARYTSKGERIRCFTSSIDGFELIARRIESSVLESDIVSHEVQISLNGTLVGPIVVSGDQAKRIFRNIEG